MTRVRRFLTIASIAAALAGLVGARPAAAQGPARGPATDAGEVRAAYLRSTLSSEPTPLPDIVRSSLALAKHLPLSVGVDNLLHSYADRRADRRMLDHLKPGLGSACRVYRVSVAVRF